MKACDMKGARRRARAFRRTALAALREVRATLGQPVQRSGTESPGAALILRGDAARALAIVDRVLGGAA